MMVLTRAQALAAGRTPEQVDALVRSGRWLALRRGVYLTRPGLPDDPAVRHACLVAAGTLATSAPCVGSHRSAVLVHGLPLLHAPPSDAVLTRTASTSGNDVARLASDVPVAHRCVVHGASVTTLARSAVDVARTTDDLEAAVVLDAALRRVPREDLEEVLARQAGWPGSARARVRVTRATGLCESPLESVGLLRCAQQGLPPPDLQVLVGDDEGPLARVDFLWREHRTVGEADGRRKYATAADLWREKQREDALRDAGYEVFRFGWADALHRPEVIRERALRAFARGGRRAA